MIPQASQLRAAAGQALKGLCSINYRLCAKRLVGWHRVRSKGARIKTLSQPRGADKSELEGKLVRRAFGIKIVGVVVLALMCWALPTSASADQIVGNITIDGGATLDTGVVGTANAVTAWISPDVDSRDGNFAAFVAVGAPVTMTAPWTFDPSGPLAAFWSVGGFTFNLLSSSVDFQNANSLVISGSGTIVGNGFDPTPGVFNFSTQAPSASGVFSFSAANGAVGVPDGGSTIGLLGFGLLGLSSLRRRFGRQ